jgi:uncharacterized protein YuzE
MRITYDKETDALAIDFRDAVHHESEEIYDGFVVDFDKTALSCATSVQPAHNTAAKQPC